MSGIIKSIFEATKDRIKSPLIGTFVMSWIAFNWKVVAMLFFSSKTIFERIFIIDNFFIDFINTIYLPLGFTLLYILGFPYIMWFFDGILIKSTKGRKSQRNTQILFDLDNEIEISKKKVLLELENANYREKADLNNTVEELKEERNSLVDELSETRNKLDESIISISEVKKKNELIIDDLDKLSDLNEKLNVQMNSFKEVDSNNKKLTEEVNKMNILSNNKNGEIETLNNEFSLQLKRNQKQEDDYKSYINESLKKKGSDIRKIKKFELLIEELSKQLANLELENSKYKMRLDEFDSKKNLNFQAEQLRRRNEIKPNFSNSGGGSSPNNVALEFKNIGKDAYFEEIETDKTKGIIIKSNRKKGSLIRTEGVLGINVKSRNNNEKSLAIPYEFTLIYYDVDNNSYKQTISGIKTDRTISLPKEIKKLEL